MKELVKNSICSLPVSIKKAIISLRTFMDGDKKKAIASLKVAYDPNFKSINTSEYKKYLEKYLWCMNNNATTTADYVRYLYNDEVILLCQGNIIENAPYILCVVKNEADKLKHFFKHYNNLGHFNYIFIDNGSSDNSIDLMRQNKATVYLCEEKYTTQRKLCWINKVYSTIPVGSWVLLLDADELLAYDGYESIPIEELLALFDKNGINTSGAIMIDMFSAHPVDTKDYYENYVFFQNSFHEEKSFYYKSVYGGIREREFNPTKERIFLLKKHPLTKKTPDEMLISCHYIYPFERNLQSNIYLALLHYKLFDSEIEKYRQIAMSGSYGKGGGSAEYKAYVKNVTTKPFESIFSSDENTMLYEGTPSLVKIKCIKDIRKLKG